MIIGVDVVEIRRSALVRYTPQQMFDLVNEVEAYPKRFAWCAGAHVLQREGDTLVARLDLRFAGMRHSFTTRNIADEPGRIEIDLVEGPFKSLQGHWAFTALSDNGCKVMLVLDFAYSGVFGGIALKVGFQGLANRMVDDFCREAARTYG